MTHLDDESIIGMMQRAMAPPGEFATTWPSVDDDTVASIVGDGFATAQLQGWFPSSVLDPGALTVTPDLSIAGQMLSVSYGSVKVLRQRILTLQGGTNVKAGPVEVSMPALATTLNAVLASAEADINRVLQQVASRATPLMGDLVSIRLMGNVGFSFEATEIPGFIQSRIPWEGMRDINGW